MERPEADMNNAVGGGVVDKGAGIYANNSPGKKTYMTCLLILRQVVVQPVHLDLPGPEKISTKHSFGSQLISLKISKSLKNSY